LNLKFSLLGVSTVFALFLMSSIATSALSAQSTQSFSTPINLSNDSYQAHYPWVANVGNKVYVAWEEGSHGVWFRASTNGGSTWSSAIRLSASGGVADYPIVYALGTDVYVVWSQSVSKELQIFFAASTNSGTSFSPAIQLTSGTSENGFITPTIAASGSDVYIAYTGNGKNSYVVSSDNYGAAGSWSAPFYYSASHEPQIAAEGSNAYAIADGVGIAVTNNAGQSWTIASSSLNDGDEPWVAASGQYVYVVSQTKTNSGNIHFFYSNNYGKAGSWTSEPGVDISGTLTDTWEPQLTVSGNYLFVTFHDLASPITNYVVVSSNNGKTWSSPQVTSESYHAISWAYQIATTGCGGGYSCTGSAQSVYSVWAAQVNKVWQVFVASSTNYGSSWSSVNVSNNPSGTTAAQNNDIAPASIAANGASAFVVWQETSSSGQSQVYFSAS
jgi:hypothetical protein